MNSRHKRYGQSGHRQPFLTGIMLMLLFSLSGCSGSADGQEAGTVQEKPAPIVQEAENVQVTGDVQEEPGAGKTQGAEAESGLVEAMSLVDDAGNEAVGTESEKPDSENTENANTDNEDTDNEKTDNEKTDNEKTDNNMTEVISAVGTSAGSDSGLEEEIDRMIAGMTLEDRVAQLFFVTPEALTGADKVTIFGDRSRSALEKYPVGGIIYLEANLVSEAQTKEMLAATQTCATERSGVPVFLGLDEEGGRVLRIGGNPGFSVARTASMAKLAAGGEEAVTAAADNIGGYLYDLGFNMDLAPDADVLTNPANQVIGDRSFGSDPETVAVLSRAYADALRERGIVPCYKHFPGHGGTLEDSHEGYAYSYKTLEEMRQAELIPFADGCSSGIEMIMVSHISMPNVTGGDLPASLSPELITGVLRGELGYQGIVITDALGMGAVSDHYAPGESAVLALQAGCDMLLMASHFPESYQAVLDAVQSGTVTEEQINGSLRRILRVKLRMAG